MKTARACLLSVVVVVVLLLAADMPGPSAQTPIVLKAVSAWTKSWVVMDMYLEWIKRVNERAAGRLNAALDERRVDLEDPELVLLRGRLLSHGNGADARSA